MKNKQKKINILFKKKNEIRTKNIYYFNSVRLTVYCKKYYVMNIRKKNNNKIKIIKSYKTIKNIAKILVRSLQLILEMNKIDLN